jgi:chromosome segregation ATPase
MATPSPKTIDDTDNPRYAEFLRTGVFIHRGNTPEAESEPAPRPPNLHNILMYLQEWLTQGNAITHQRLNIHRDTIETVEKVNGGLKVQIVSLEDRLKSAQRAIVEMDRRESTLIDHVGNINDLVTALIDRVKVVEKASPDKLYDNLNRAVTGLRDEITTLATVAHVGVLAERVKKLEGWKESHRESIECHREDISSLQNEGQEIKAYIAPLTSRLTKLEERLNAAIEVIAAQQRRLIEYGELMLSVTRPKRKAAKKGGRK